MICLTFICITVLYNFWCFILFSGPSIVIINTNFNNDNYCNFPILTSNNAVFCYRSDPVAQEAVDG